MALAEVFALQQIGPDQYRGHDPVKTLGRSWWPAPAMHGGQLVGQALRAAIWTADFAPHSLHAYFSKPADPARPVDYLVRRVRDGGAFQLRSVDAVQEGTVVLTMTASFQRETEEGGFDYQVAAPAGSPDPESLPCAGGVLGHLQDTLGVDVRTPPLPADVVGGGVSACGPDGGGGAVGGGGAAATGRLWIRPSAHPLPETAPCLLAFASDLSVHFSIRYPVLGTGMMLERPDITTASLDHAIWFQRPFPADGWLLYDLYAHSVSGPRGLSRGALFDRTGRLVASTTQEVLIRSRKSREAAPSRAS